LSGVGYAELADRLTSENNRIGVFSSVKLVWFLAIAMTWAPAVLSVRTMT
jgi:hypothetical protein